MSLLMVSENPKVLESINTQSLTGCQLGEAEWVHSWIKENYQLIFGELNYELIGQEVNVTGSGAEGYLDFLAVDMASGDTVILECKRDDFKHRDLIGQAIEYAAGIAGFSKEKLDEVYTAFSGNDQSTSLDTLLIQQGTNILNINCSQKIILVVQNSNKNQGTLLRLKSECAYMRKKGIDINILELSWYTKDMNTGLPKQGDIIEFKFVWDIEALETQIPSGNTSKSSSSTPIPEATFLLNKSDLSIQLYDSLVQLLESNNIKYKRRPASKYITFYGKSKAFMIVMFNEDSITLRLRLENEYDSPLVTRLDSHYDKLAEVDNFIYQLNISSPESIEKLMGFVLDSYKYNG